GVHGCFPLTALSLGRELAGSASPNSRAAIFSRLGKNSPSPHEPAAYEKTASSPPPSPPEEEREMRSGCLARAINRSLLTEFAAVWGSKCEISFRRNLSPRERAGVRGKSAPT